MSYYMGDYYSGDPGIGSFFRGLASTAVGFIPGIGPLASRAISSIGARPAATSALARITQPAVSMMRPVAGAITAAARTTAGAIAKHPVLSAAGAAGALAGGVALSSRGGMVPGKGMHVSKKSGKLVRNRRMNFCNPRALRRATRRLHAFSRHYRKVVGFVSPRRPKGRMYFKARRRKAA